MVHLVQTFIDLCVGLLSNTNYARKFWIILTLYNQVSKLPEIQSKNRLSFLYILIITKQNQFQTSVNREKRFTRLNIKLKSYSKKYRVSNNVHNRIWKNQSSETVLEERVFLIKNGYPEIVNYKNFVVKLKNGNQNTFREGRMTLILTLILAYLPYHRRLFKGRTGTFFSAFFWWKSKISYVLYCKHLFTDLPLTHFIPLCSFYTHWIHQKISGCLMFSGGIEVEHWLKNSLKNKKLYDNFVFRAIERRSISWKIQAVAVMW